MAFFTVVYGRHLPPGVTTSDLPGNEPKSRPMKGECAVCGRAVPAHFPPRKDPHTPRFCDEHDDADLRAKEAAMAADEQIERRYEPK